RSAGSGDSARSTGDGVSRDRRGVEDPGRDGEEPSEPGTSGAGAGSAAAEKFFMTCGELEILLCDYVDGVLDEAGAGGVESHLQTCPACAELARDAKEAVAFVERVAEVEPPVQLTARILAETGSGRHGQLGKRPGIRAWLMNWAAPVL